MTVVLYSDLLLAVSAATLLVVGENAVWAKPVGETTSGINVSNDTETHIPQNVAYSTSQLPISVNTTPYLDTQEQYSSQEPGCHEECSGCFGPEPTQCFICVHFNQSGTCVKVCNETTFYPRADLPATCSACDQRCHDVGCFGPAETDCKSSVYSAAKDGYTALVLAPFAFAVLLVIALIVALIVVYKRIRKRQRISIRRSIPLSIGLNSSQRETRQDTPDNSYSSVSLISGWRKLSRQGGAVTSSPKTPPPQGESHTSSIAKQVPEVRQSFDVSSDRENSTNTSNTAEGEARVTNPSNVALQTESSYCETGNLGVNCASTPLSRSNNEKSDILRRELTELGLPDSGATKFKRSLIERKQQSKSDLIREDLPNQDPAKEPIASSDLLLRSKSLPVATITRNPSVALSIKKTANTIDPLTSQRLVRDSGIGQSNSDIRLSNESDHLRALRNGASASSNRQIDRTSDRSLSIGRDSVFTEYSDLESVSDQSAVIEVYENLNRKSTQLSVMEEAGTPESSYVSKTETQEQKRDHLSKSKSVKMAAYLKEPGKRARLDSGSSLTHTEQQNPPEMDTSIKKTTDSKITITTVPDKDIHHMPSTASIPDLIRHVEQSYNQPWLIDVERFNQTDPRFQIGVFDKDGGELCLPVGRTRLYVPQDAVTLPTVIYLYADYETEYHNGCAVTYTPTIECGPDGLQFQRAVTLTLGHCAVKTDLRHLAVISQSNGDSRWQMEPQTALLRTADDSVSVQLHHFTRYRVIDRRHDYPVEHDEDPPEENTERKEPVPSDAGPSSAKKEGCPTKFLYVCMFVRQYAKGRFEGTVHWMIKDDQLLRLQQVQWLQDSQSTLTSDCRYVEAKVLQFQKGKGPLVINLKAIEGCSLMGESTHSIDEMVVNSCNKGYAGFHLQCDDKEKALCEVNVRQKDSEQTTTLHIILNDVIPVEEEIKRLQGFLCGSEGEEPQWVQRLLGLEAAGIRRVTTGRLKVPDEKNKESGYSSATGSQLMPTGFTSEKEDAAV
ncbi:uncharacterized protein LOC106162262 [Lingula anatina]|uniref:Netrin receptor UNC5 n=1 Tax=Lingula anatina TaxID=7574 RepID=A0A1S3I9J6_LINAN|nr:uncharacterized protein LOC106162262 [Lingula anatina]|eukprot:XP_013394935.1 uncharacterized protein LOC106162262 [Lingula anatina]